MTVEGIWSGEVYGPFGWENRGIYVFENGRIIGGDNRQYSTGSYGVSGERVTAEVKVLYYGPPRTSFGEKSEAFSLTLDGKMQDETIDGRVSRPDKSKFELRYRLTKRMALPAS